MTTGQAEEWLAQGLAGGLLQPPCSVVPMAGGLLRVSATIAVAGKSVGILIEIPTDFPISLPPIRLQVPDSLGYLPHVSASGGVCYADSEGLLLNRQRPDLVLTWAVEHTQAVLTIGLGPGRVAEFMRELEVYWAQISKTDLYNLLDPSAAVSAASVYTARNLRLLAANEAQVPRWFLPEKGPMLVAGSATYLPLLAGTAFVPPRSDEPFWTIEQLRALVEPTLAAMSPKRRRQLFKKDGCWKGTLALAIPTADNHYSLIGIDYASPKGFHPFDSRGRDFELRPVQLHRIERSYIVPRGGGKTDLAAKKVLLIGCGAIGGHLAYELVRAGVQWLTLVDHDTLSIHNMHRHALGKSGLGKFKTEGLRDDIQEKYLYAEVTSVAKKFQEARAAGELKPEAFDLIIAATGEATLELYLNEQLRLVPQAPPIIYSWLEPYGLGGHALLTWPTQPGCLQCLYTSDDSDAPLANRALFAAPEQEFSVALSGCGSLHTPYASQDASQTAILAARLAINALTGREKASPLWSWKGDKREFKAAGFKTGPRYKLSEETLRREATIYISPTCPVCGDKTNALNV
jgi:molybdopterin/thiamine biosynthesis adenylyltransferase